MLKNQQNRLVHFVMPADAEELFDKGFQTGPSKLQAAKAFSCLVADLNLNVRQQNEILHFLKTNTRSLNLFIKSKDSATDVPPVASSMDTSVRNSMSDYFEPDNRDTTLDVCRNGCMVFMGFRDQPDGEDPIDCSIQIYCLECKAPRYSPCPHSDCQGKRYEECNKFASRTDPSIHRWHEDRVPLETVWFRSTMSKLAQLYCLSLTRGNDRLLKYHEDRYQKPGKIMDICDGTEVIKHQSIMSERFKMFSEDFMRMNPTMTIAECSLCLTFFYDGGVNYKRGADSMWPLVTSVANCNPSNRTKLGVGCSLSLLHNMAGSGVEKFLLQLYAKELKAIESGIVFVVAGANSEADRNVYLQARLVYMHVDTKALESVTCSKGSGSKMCSCCNLNAGVWNPIFKKVNYFGNRNTMHIDHLIRYVGEDKFDALTVEDEVEDLDYKEQWEKKKLGVYTKSFVVCSAEEHQRRYYECERSVFQTTINKTNAFVLDSRPSTQLRRSVINAEIGHGKLQLPQGCRNESDFIKSKVWYNHLFPYSKLQRHMRFPFSDSREQILWRHVDNETYCHDGRIGRAQHDEYETDLKLGIEAGTRERPKTKYDASYNGRHDVCPLMDAGLESFGFENVCFDEMHRAANAMRYFIAEMKGDRAVADMDRKFSAATKKIPSMKYKNRLAEFQLLNREENMVDAITNSILVSPLYIADFSLKYPFQQTGFLKSHECFVLLMVYLPYLLSFTDLHENFREFYARYSYDMRCYMDPCLDAETLREQYIPNIYETRMVQEGLFPESECVYIFHEIIDIIHQIEKYGHVRSLMCYFGERAMGMMKSFITKGGVRYMKTLYHRYVAKENSIAARLTNNELFFTNHTVPRYSDFVLKLLGKGKTFNWHVADKDGFFESLMKFVQSQCIHNIHKKSPFFRLYKAFEDNVLQQDNDPPQFSGFVTWIGGLNEIFLTGKILDISLTSFFVNDVLQSTDFDYVKICNGYIYLVDFLAVKDSILGFNPMVHNKLITKGILFNCRGHESGGLAGVLEGNDWNKLRFGADLKTCWHRRGQYSSFVRITEFETVTTGNIDASQRTSSGELVGKLVPGTTPGAERFKRTASCLSDGGESDSEESVSSEIDEMWENEELNKQRVYGEKVKFGQINSCWRTDMPGDEVVHGLAFANVTLRRTKYNARRRHFSIPATWMGYQAKAQRFISVNYIDSTSIGVSAISKRALNAEETKKLKGKKGKEKQKETDSIAQRLYSPMLKPEGAQSFIQFTDASKQSSGSYAKQDAAIHELFMIELHPERVTYRYDCICPDSDGTKLWEHS
jgi:hypothetical protein